MGLIQTTSQDASALEEKPAFINRQARLLGEDGLAEFRFSDEGWHEIVPYLPPGIRAKPDVARRVLQRIGERYRAGWYPDNPADHARAWRDVQQLSIQLQDAIGRARQVETYLQFLMLALGDLAEEAAFNADQYDLLVGPGRRRQPDLDRKVLYRYVVGFWVQHGGKLRSSRGSMSGKPSGPAVRFLEAVLTGMLGQPIGREAVVKIIRHERIRLDPGRSLDE